MSTQHANVSLLKKAFSRPCQGRMNDRCLSVFIKHFVHLFMENVHNWKQRGHYASIHQRHLKRRWTCDISPTYLYAGLLQVCFLLTNNITFTNTHLD